MFLIQYRRDGEKAKTIQYKTEKSMKNKLQELSDDPLVVSVHIFKEITYGEQRSLFNSDDLPF